MKRILTALLCCLLVLSFNDLQAQSKGSSGKAKTTSSKSKTSTSKSKKGKKTAPVKEKPAEAQLTYNCNDCLFPMTLQVDVPFGPTVAPNGAGRVMEIKADKKHPQLFEMEHNTVWYKFTIPYNGNLEFTITPNNPKDDYDFLLYRYTDAYFSNHIIQNKVLPIAGNVAGVDSTSKDGAIGMRDDSTSCGRLFVKANETGAYVKSIPVHKGEVYYLVLDNKTAKGEGHTVKLGIHVEAVTPEVRFYDAKTKKPIAVDLTITEKETGERAIVSNKDFRSGKVKFVPNFHYTIRANKTGYFSVYKENFNRDQFMADTILRFSMNRTERGTRFAISDIYFEDGETELLPISDTVLMEYVGLFLNHPDVTFLIKGYVPTYGTNPPEDQRISLGRAESVKKFMIKQGIAEERMRVAGMSVNEIKKVASAVLDRKESFSPVKIELIITSMNETNYK